MFHPTAQGTPQGGIISPTAANMALNGLMGRLRTHFGRPHKVNLVRSADDFIITGDSQLLLEEGVKPLVVQFLKERGLELAEEKTRVVHIDRGFDFLGFNVRKYRGKLLIKPAASSIAAVKEKAREIIRTAKSLPQGILIRRLNPVIRGWGNYYRHVVSKDVFNDVDHAIWRMTWNWAKRRHPQHARKWVKDRYYARREGYDWVFTDGSVDLFRMLSIPIRRHVLIRGASNPYDPEHASYFAARRAGVCQGSCRINPFAQFQFASWRWCRRLRSVGESWRCGPNGRSLTSHCAQSPAVADRGWPPGRALCGDSTGVARRCSLPPSQG